MLSVKGHEVPPALVWGLTAAVATVLIGMWHQKRRKRNQIPSRWRHVGELTELTLFPLKSGAGISLQEADCTEYGIQTVSSIVPTLRDRFFIVYDEKNGEFKTARTYNNMVLIKVSADGGNTVKLSAPNMPDLRVKIPDGSEKQKYTHCTIWNDEKVGAVDCGDEAAAWLSKYMMGAENGVRLGYHIAESMPRRTLIPKFKQFLSIRTSDLGAFSDLTGFMLMTESSVRDLESRIPSHLSIKPRQFRPNFLVNGTDPFEEDNWNFVRIGETAVFRNVKPCTRCVFTTIDPDTGIREPTREPLKTLNKYRKMAVPVLEKMQDQSPALGVNLGLYSHGMVRVGDKVYVGEE